MRRKRDVGFFSVRASVYVSFLKAGPREGDFFKFNFAKIAFFKIMD
jgi:hypothetical protein